MNVRPLCLAAAVLASTFGTVNTASAAGMDRGEVKAVVDAVIRPLMREHGIPGAAVGIVTKHGSDVFSYGVASRETSKPVTRETLFEIGSISKTFTAALASYAQVTGHLSMSGSIGEHYRALNGSALGEVSLLHLGTHTPGGFPLQVPDAIANNEQLIEYFRNWKPAYAPGTYRTYANPSIGLFGVIAAASLEEGFVSLLEDRMFPALGMSHTFLDVPGSETENYAQGYTKKNTPIRMAPGVLAAEAYGVRTTAADMVRFIQANMGMLDLDGRWQQAIVDTHTGYFRIGAMTQDLIWEQYDYPVALDDLLAGNSPKISYEPNPAVRIEPPSKPRKDVLINKTGSTNGFGAYVAFIPEKELGVVVLANRNYPIDARVRAVHRILTQLDSE